MLNFDENKTEKCCAAHIFHSCQQYCSERGTSSWIDNKTVKNITALLQLVDKMKT